MNWLRNVWSMLPERLRAYIPKLIEYLVISAIVSLATRYGWPKIQPEPFPVYKEVVVPGPPSPPDGWIDDPEAVKKALGEIEAIQGFKPDFSKVAHADVWREDDKAVFFWEAEQKVLGRILPSWDQGSIGSCVSHGWGRGVQDLTLIQIANNHGVEEWPGAEVNREAIYGGSRVEIGGGRIGGDGSVGAWAAKWCEQYGILFNKNYPGYDLSGGYSIQRCRDWGRRGCPDQLESIAKEHPVKGVALVKSAGDVWAAIGNGYPVPICSNVGFQSPIRDGFCERRGSWAHCMEVRGRFTHPTRGKCFVIQNSWGDYLKGDGSNNQIEVRDRQGKVTLPQGCFACTERDMDVIVRQNDSFAISAFKGFPARRIDWSAKAAPIHPRDDRAVAARDPEFALAP